MPTPEINTFDALLRHAAAWKVDSTRSVYTVVLALDSPYHAQSPLTYTREELDSLDVRIAPVIDTLLHAGKVPHKIQKTLQRTHKFWSQAKPLINKTGRTHHFDTWLALRTISTSRVIITARCYTEVCTTPEGVLYTESGRQELDLHINIDDMEKQYPGFKQAHALVDLLASSPKQAAVYCMAQLGLTKPSVVHPEVTLPISLIHDV